LDVLLQSVHLADGDHRAPFDLRSIHNGRYMYSECGDYLRCVIIREDEDEVAVGRLRRRWNPYSLQTFRSDGLYREAGRM